MTGPLAPTVEVVLCTFNGTRFLKPQLDSILLQSRPIQTLSVFDDGSSDDTVALVESCADAFRRIGIEVRLTVNPVNLGYAGNFARALAAAREDIVFLCDQDDLWYRDKVATLVAAIEATGVALAFSDGMLIDENGRRLGEETVLSTYGLQPDDVREFGRMAETRLTQRNYVNGAAAAVRRSTAQAALPVPAGLPHDYWLALWCAASGGVYGVPACLYGYRQHGRNVIGIGGSNRLYQWLAIWRRPLEPRLQDLRRMREIRERLVSVPGLLARLVEEKLRWLDAVVGEPVRAKRAFNIAAAWTRGRYRRFAPPMALTRDLVGLLKRR